MIPSSPAGGRSPAVRLSRSVTLATAYAVALAIGAAEAGAQDLRYTLTPTAEQLRWANALGLDDAFLYGARAGIVFGKLVELQGFYLTSQGTDARVRDLYARLNIGGTPPQHPGLDVMNYGANMVFNFGTGAITPYVRGGGSILRFEPAGGQASSRIALQYAGGLKFGKPGGLRLNLFAEDLRFRVDRTLLLNVPGALGTNGQPVTDVEASKLRHSVAYGGGLTLPFGGAVTYNDQPTSSLTNLSLPLDLFAGRLDFHDALGLPRQYLVGVRSGIDFGPLVGLRGFYWRGVNSDFKHTQPVQSYGGEAQFGLNAGAGLSPFIVLGAGQIDFRPGYSQAVGDTTVASGPTSAGPADRMTLIGGGGIRVPVLSHFVLTLTARDYLMAREGRLQDVNQTSQLKSSWQYTAGLSLQVGGRTKGGRPSSRTDTVFVNGATGQRMTAPNVVYAGSDTIVVTQRGDTLRGARADSALAADRTLERRIVARATSTQQGYASDRVTQIVVPTEGEIIVRYGPQRAPAPRPAEPREDQPMRERVYERDLVPGTGQPLAGRSGVSAGELRDIVRESVREELTLSGGSTQPPTRPSPRATSRADLRVRKDTVGTGARMSDADLAAMEQRIVDRVMARVDERIDMRVRDLRAAAPTAPSPTAPAPAPTPSLTAADVRSIVREEVARAQPAPPAPTTATERVRERTTGPTGGGIQGGTVYSGFTFTDGAQALLGGRVDLGDISPGLPGFRLVPEIGFGFGNSATSTYVAGNLLYEFGGVRLGILGRVRPRFSVGAGFINFSGPVGGHDGLEVVFTPAYGATTDLPLIRGVLRALSAGNRAPELLVEHQGIGFFDINRLVIGLTYRR